MEPMEWEPESYGEDFPEEWGDAEFLPGLLGRSGSRRPARPWPGAFFRQGDGRLLHGQGRRDRRGACHR